MKENKEWNLLSINNLTDSLFQILENKPEENICGLTVPWLYFGMLFSTFCWHVEDLYLYSINLLHHGSPKLWYGISHTDKEKMDKYIQDKCKKIKLNDPYIRHKLILMIDPKELTENGIVVYKCIQNPGEIVLTLPKAYHAGFSTGFNIAEAVNFSVRI